MLVSKWRVGHRFGRAAGCGSPPPSPPPPSVIGRPAPAGVPGHDPGHQWRRSPHLPLGPTPPCRSMNRRSDEAHSSAAEIAAAKDVAVVCSPPHCPRCQGDCHITPPLFCPIHGGVTGSLPHRPVAPQGPPSPGSPPPHPLCEEQQLWSTEVTDAIGWENRGLHFKRVPSSLFLTGHPGMPAP